ncbi:MAG: hypothetical protein NWF04_01310 [Candidatus Bathyarchaeota archaeon]|nr:hypothetical protein [Candidatus Bathyarchaeota archaeon]
MADEFVWDKAVICVFRERFENHEADPFVVVRCKKLVVCKSEDGKLAGSITDFFTLMGDADYISSPEGMADQYVMCWFDDNESDTTKDLRRLRGVTFPTKPTYTTGAANKRTYNATFKAEQGKLK